MNALTAHRNTAGGDRDLLAGICIGNGHTITSKIHLAIGNTVGVQCGIACLHRVECNILVQFHCQGSIALSIICSYYTDVAIRQLAGIIGSAYYIELLTQFYFLSRCVIALDVEAGFGGTGSRSLHQPFNITDIGCIGICVAAALHIGNLLAAHAETVGRQRDGLCPCRSRSDGYATSRNQCLIPCGIFRRHTGQIRQGII